MSRIRDAAYFAFVVGTVAAITAGTANTHPSVATVAFAGWLITLWAFGAVRLAPEV